MARLSVREGRGTRARAAADRGRDWDRPRDAYSGGDDDDRRVREAIDAALARAAEKKSKPSNVKEASAAAFAAVAAKDVAAMLAALEAPGLWAPSVETDRRHVWSTLLAKSRKALGFDRMVRALAEESAKTAHIISYKLYTQKHLAKDLARAIVDVDRRVPRLEPLAERLKTADAEWPDFLEVSRA